MGNAAILFLFIFLFGLGMLGVAATGFAAFRGTRAYFVPLFVFSLLWGLGVLIITFHYFLYVYVEDHLRTNFRIGYAIYALNVVCVFFLLRALHVFAGLRRVPAEAAATVIAALSVAVAFLPSPLPAQARTLPALAAHCAMLVYAAAVLLRNAPSNQRTAAERGVAFFLFALLAATTGADYFLELSSLHPLTADHFSFAAWHALVLVLMARRQAERRKAPSRTAGIDAIAADFKLSPREKQTLEGIRRGWSNKRIALELSIEETTVKTYVAALFQKCGTASRYELMSKFR